MAEYFCTAMAVEAKPKAQVPKLASRDPTWSHSSVLQGSKVPKYEAYMVSIMGVVMTSLGIYLVFECLDPYQVYVKNQLVS